MCLCAGDNIVCTLSSLSFVTLFDSRHCPEKIAGNVCVSAVAGIGGLGNVAKRNAKTDQLRLVPRDKCN